MTEYPSPINLNLFYKLVLYGCFNFKLPLNKGAISPNTLMGVSAEYWPITTSIKNIGMPSTMRNKKYGIKKARPPCIYTKKGNLHKLPRPWHK
jgi:hypothetical protein